LAVPSSFVSTLPVTQNKDEREFLYL